MKIRTSMREALTDKNLLGKALPGPSWHYLAHHAARHHGRAFHRRRSLRPSPR